MLVAEVIVNQFAAFLGVLAGGIAVGGFLAHAGPAMAGKQEMELRRATARGGLVGLWVSLLVVVLSAILAKVVP